MPSLRVVLVHWNQPERLAATVAAFRASAGVDVRITVVDNGSSAPPPTGVADDLVDAGANIGFGPGANVGLRRFLADPDDGEWVAVAPHDALPAPDCLRRLLDVLAERPEAGLACADYGDGATPVVDPYFGGIPGPLTVDEGWEPAGYPHGTLLVARRACLDDIGLFDERYFSYCEEADLGLRARTAGWDVGLVRGALVRNPELHGALPAVSYLQLRNTLLLVREHSGCYHAAIRLQLALVQLGVGLAWPARRDPYWHVEGKVRAMADFVRGRYGPPPADLLVQGNP
jgi:N-acetylglucosaminyl-diphospho-decaprenol L-rhamnosyltransferase